MKLQRLKIVTPQALKDINKLLPQLSSSVRPLSLGNLSRIVKERNNSLFVFREKGIIIGMSTLVFIRTPTGLRARVEDVVVDEKYRGKGLGENLVRRLISEAKRKKARYLDLTTSPNRKAANKLYEKLGFKKRDTNVYRMLL